MTPFRKCVSSNLLKKTNNPNPSPTGKIWFGLYLFGAGNRTRSNQGANAVQPAFGNAPLGYCIEVGSSPAAESDQQKRARKGLFFVGAGNRTRTCTLTQWNLNPPSLPIPPCPRIRVSVYHEGDGLSMEIAAPFFTAFVPPFVAVQGLIGGANQVGDGQGGIIIGQAHADGQLVGLS